MGGPKALLLTNTLHQDWFEQIENNLLRNGPPQDAFERIGGVLNNPNTWPRLLPEELDDYSEQIRSSAQDEPQSPSGMQGQIDRDRDTL